MDNEPPDSKYTEDIISIEKQILKAKANGKSKDYIVHCIKMQGCPHGRKNCRICAQGSLGKSINKGKGKNKKENTVYND
ncbi:Hypothetical protein HVR_LOCUS1268 [uncultured virus]|nr:Hypothetical protein HVR_LOCUS1268 [uncultured virus]